VLAALVLAAAAILASACNVPPPAASANGATISVDTLNTELRTLESTVAGTCLLQVQNPQLTPQAIKGTGGSGTYTMAFTDAVLKERVGDLLAEQYANARGITISSSDLTKATSDFQATLDGEITSAVQQSQASGTVSQCETTSGPITGAQLLAGLSGPVRDAEIRNEAVDEKLLAQGANLSDAAVALYYSANQPQFTFDCVSDIATDTSAHAQQLLAQLRAGSSFGDLAKSSSLDSQSAAGGGALGCNFSQSSVEQALQLQSVSTGQPLGPQQDQTTGRWVIYEVTSQSVEPLSSAASVVREELLHATSNLNRVSRELVVFAHRSDISVDPEYGTWKALTIVPPHGPPDRYLLPTVAVASPLGGTSGAGLGSSGSSGSSGTSSGSSGTSSGSSGTSGSSGASGG
jgi:hypothetical protein